MAASWSNEVFEDGKQAKANFIARKKHIIRIFCPLFALFCFVLRSWLFLFDFFTQWKISSQFVD